MRLNRFLAAAGLGSRRHCDGLIAEGRVTVNGQPCTNFSTQIEESDHVKVDHRLVRQKENLTILLHKPAGFVSTRRDPKATDTIYDLLPAKFSQLFNVGRLDAQTGGSSPSHERRRSGAASHPSALQGGEGIRGHARQTLGAQARREIASGNFSRWETRPAHSRAAIWPDPAARRPATGLEPPDPPDVLRARLRSEAACPDPHRPPAAGRFAARQLASPNEKRAGEVAIVGRALRLGRRRARPTITRARPAKLRGAESIRLRSW